ncbi:hypothetical protein EB796_021757 [Bugula neritina]|uniref:PX domain-containing protein n=1 Tax=Bugula neritina TaxID=10212 RepID=A0A7J7J286_BUGNE|nr:hypothetical protein EB796_021757 [Bugula neritina]
MAYKHLSSVECISIEKRGFIPNRYYVYVLIVEWSDGDKHPIYRKYSSFYDFEKMLHDRIGHKSSIPELPAMNILQKAFKIEKNHISEINEFCMSILRLSEDIVRSVVVSSFFEAWATDFPMEDSSVENRLPAKKKDAKKKLPVDSSNKNSSILQTMTFKYKCTSAL